MCVTMLYNRICVVPVRCCICFPRETNISYDPYSGESYSLMKEIRLKTRPLEEGREGLRCTEYSGPEKDWAFDIEISGNASCRCWWWTKGKLARWIGESWIFQAEGTEWAKTCRWESGRRGLVMLTGVLFNSHLLSLERNDFLLSSMHWRRFKGGKKARDKVKRVIICFPPRLSDFMWVFGIWDRNEAEWFMYIIKARCLKKMLCPGQMSYMFNTWSIAVLTESLSQRKEAVFFNKESLFSSRSLNCN